MRYYRIGIDCRLAGHRHAGIGRYVVELVKRLIPNQNIEWVLFCTDLEQVTELVGSSLPSNCEIVYTPVRHYTALEQWKMNNAFSKARLDLVHVPHFNVPILYSGKMVVTIHDLLWHERKGLVVTTLPAWQYWIKYLFYRFITRKAVQKASCIFVPTQVVKHTLQRYFPTSGSKIVVTPEGISEALLTLAHKKQSKERKPNQLLYVGSLYPHKNVKLVIQSLQQLPEYSLIIVGSRNVFRAGLEKLVEKLQLTKRVIFKQNVGDAELAELYATSTALVQPSFSEGFGLTGLEALAFYTPVVASDIPVFHEVYQAAATYFDPHSTESFIDAIKKIADRAEAVSFKKSADKVIAQNNWNLLADTTFQRYLTVLTSNNE